MNYVVLARKWRPQRFSDLVGQEPIARTLENAIRLGRVPHALLLTGTRGVGKTTTARIVAKALNCEKGPAPSPCGECSNCTEIAAGTNVDVREIDGASNTSVDDVRELKENVRYAPSKSKHKIYIIDEVHMLSTSAFNALLKTLEEPPPGVIFIFATTEAQKIPDTILSRCQRFDFREISDAQVAAHLRKIVDQEKISISDASLALVARQAAGSLRDALSLLDQVVAFTGEKVPDEEVVSILGLTDRHLITRTLESFAAHDAKAALDVFAEVLGKGFDPKSYLVEVWERVRDLLVLKSGADRKLVRATPDETARLEQWAKDLNEAELERWFDLLRATLNDVGRSEFPRYLIEVSFLKITRETPRMPMETLVERLETLERRLGSGAPERANPSPPTGGVKPAPIPSVSSGGTPHKASASPSASAGWPQLLESVKRQRPPLAAILLQAAGASVDGGTITLTFDEGSFCVSRAQDPDFQSYLTGAAAELLGGSYKVEVATQPKAAAAGDSKASVDRAREKEALENPAIQRAVSMFQAKIEEIKPLK